MTNDEWSFDGTGRLLRQRALDLADAAIARLGDVSTDRDNVIHDVRKKLKELRAATELLRSHLPEHGRRDRTKFRDAGRLLSATRDAKASVEAFDHLREHFADEWRRGEFLKIRRALARRLPEAIDMQAIGRLMDTLLTARRRIAAWPVDDVRQDEVWSAFRRGYRLARRAMAEALETNRPELLHEWRKRVKAHWHHAELATEVGVARLEKYAKKVHKLADILGDHHDLVVLDQLIRQSPESFGSPLYVVRFLDYVARRLRNREEHAAEAGRELFADRPKAWEVQARATMLRHGPKRAERSPASRVTSASA